MKFKIKQFLFWNCATMVIMIDFSFEKKFRIKNRCAIIAGLDEVGRGPLAGPVTAAAFLFISQLSRRKLRFLRDSKLLSAQQRETLYRYFCELKKEGSVDFASASAFPVTIDKRHIHHASVLAMRRAIQKLSITPDHAIIDKFPYAGTVLYQLPYSMIKKADNLVPSCAAASIVAKVRRDAAMLRYHKKYPEYRFDLHKGYGTKLHYQKLAKYGPSSIHRQSFRLR